MKELKMHSSEKKVPVFCKECGCKLETKPILERYDEISGEKLMGTRLYCLNDKWWKIFTSWYSNHTWIEFYSDGNQVIYRDSYYDYR